MSWIPEISARARAVPGTRVHVMDARPNLRIRHVMLVPAGACPVSGNPITGLAVVTYTTSALVVEIVSLRKALIWATTSREEGTPKNIEALAEWLHMQVSSAVRAPVQVSLYLLIRPGPQVYSVTREG